MINITKHPELHIRSVTETELAGLEVRCILQSIVDESVKVERPERGRLQRLQLGFSYNELRSVGNEISVLRVRLQFFVGILVTALTNSKKM